MLRSLLDQRSGVSCASSSLRMSATLGQAESTTIYKDRRGQLDELDTTAMLAAQQISAA